jgi:hypothetical protein
MPGATAKNPDKVRAGRIGAEVRWHAPRTVDIADLTGEQRRLVLALVAAARAAKAADDAARG